MKVAKLVYYSFVTRVVVEESATDDQIIQASRQNMVEKVQTCLGENLEEIDDDEECPFGTFDTDEPTIDRVILNVQEQQYLMIGKGIPTQVRKFDTFSDWDSIKDLNNEPVFDVQIDEVEGEYQFQYVDLEYRDDSVNGWSLSTGSDYQSVVPEVVTQPIVEILTEMLNKKA